MGYRLIEGYRVIDGYRLMDGYRPIEGDLLSMEEPGRVTPIGRNPRLTSDVPGERETLPVGRLMFGLPRLIVRSGTTVPREMPVEGERLMLGLVRPGDGVRRAVVSDCPGRRTLGMLTPRSDVDRERSTDGVPGTAPVRGVPGRLTSPDGVRVIVDGVRDPSDRLGRWIDGA